METTEYLSKWAEPIVQRMIDEITDVCSMPHIYEATDGFVVPKIGGKAVEYTVFQDGKYLQTPCPFPSDGGRWIGFALRFPQSGWADVEIVGEGWGAYVSYRLTGVASIRLRILGADDVRIIGNDAAAAWLIMQRLSEAA